MFHAAFRLPPAARRALVPLVALAALPATGCGGPGDADTAEADTEFRPVAVAWEPGDAPAVRIRALEGAAVRLSTGAFSLQRTGAAAVDTEIRDGVLRIGCRGGRLRLALPAGGRAGVLADSGAVQVAGEWEGVDVKTDAGGIVAEGRFAREATLRSNTGDIELRATGYEGALSCETAGGSIAVQVPASATGEVNLASRSGALDVAKHQRLWMKIGPREHSIVGWLGPKPTVGERRAQTTGQVPPPPSVRAHSATGDVTFRVVDPE